MRSIIDTYSLSNGTQIPVVGFGTWQTAPEIAKSVVKSALVSGYRHIDTAEMYGNEKEVGQAIKESGISRRHLWVTSKLNNSFHSYDLASQAIDQSLADLGLDYLDLFLIHWPNPVAFRDENWEAHLQDTWRALEDAYQAGKLKAIGVSNFRKHHLQVLEQTQKVAPMVNQIRICPGDLDQETITYSRDHGMLLEAYSPLGTGKIFTEPTMQEIAQETGKTVAQVCLRWSLQHGFLPLPKSIHPNYIEDNTKIFDFELSPEQMQRIDALDGVVGYATDPDTAGF